MAAVPVSTVCVTGMHRAGTSLVARVVNLLGVDLGRADQLMEPKPDNPKGFWESGPITAVNDDLLDHLGGRWDQPPVLQDGWEESSALDPFRERARGVLDAAFGAAPIRGWKDPRMSILLPFWRTVTDVGSTIVVLRRARDVASSIAARDGKSLADSALLWVRYMGSALHTAPDALVVQYDDFFGDLDGTLDRLVTHLDLAPPDEEARAEIDRFLDPGLRHHRSDEPEARDEDDDAEGALLLADLLFDEATSGRGPAVAGALQRLMDVRGTEVVRLIDHRDDMIAQRDKAMSLFDGVADELRQAHDRLAVQGEALGRLEVDHRTLGRQLQERDAQLVALREQLQRRQPPWRRLRSHRPPVVSSDP